MKQKAINRKPIQSFTLLLLLVFFSFTGANLNAQQVSGTVVDTSGTPLPGISVVEKGTTNGTSTDFNGTYSLALKNGKKTLVFSSLGFEKLELTIGNKTVINATLQDSNESLDEIVVIGYARVKREKVLGSVASVTAEQMEKSTPIQAFDAIQGKVSGVQIRTNNGPGQGFDVQIRGISSLGGSTNPLFVVNGQQLDNIDNIDPADIKSLDVLKDAASTSLYGARGANGVVVITTKRGKAGELTLDVSNILSISTLVGDLRVANADDRLFYEGTRSGRGNLHPWQRDSLSTLFRNSYNLQKLMMKPAVRTQTNVALSGGSEKARFYWNTGFLQEGGIVRNSGYKRANTNLRLDLKPNNWLDIATNVNLSFEDRSGVNESEALGTIVDRIPFFPLFEENGEYTRRINGQRNPLAEADFGVNSRRTYRATIFNDATVKLVKNLTFRTTVGASFRVDKILNFEPVILQNPNGEGFPSGRERIPLSYGIQQENVLNYGNSWGDHNLVVIAATQVQREVTENSDFSANQFVNDRVQTFNNTAPEVIISRSENSREGLFSLVGSAAYDYKGKYLIGGSIRRDGSSKFATNNKFAYFPSASAGWNIAKENFLKENTVINRLMLKASWGVVGNEDGLGRYEFFSSLRPGSTYNGEAGIAPARLGNPDLKWETTTSSDLGLNLALLDNRLEVDVAFWKRKTADLLASVPLPEETGFGSVRRNIGNIENRGFDLNINATIIRTENFTWSSNFNIGYLENEVTKLAGGTQFQAGRTLIEEGQPIGNFFGYRNLGVYQYNESNAYTDNGVRLMPVVENNRVVYEDFTNSQGVIVNRPVYTLNGQPYAGDAINKHRAANIVSRGGDIIWEDLPDADGNYNFVIDDFDRQILGNGLANVFGGFSHNIRYKNFGVSFQFDYSLNHDIYARWDQERNDTNSIGETPGPERIYGQWMRPGDVTVYPRLSRLAQNNVFGSNPQSFFVTDGSYIKFRYIRFNYSLPKDVIKKIKGVSNISLNFAVNNVLTWTNYNGYNPEFGSRGAALTPNEDNMRFPNDREFILGLNVQLK
ncbi:MULTISPECIES: SusC/RagA family TonB-linked outer membrane protein [unclassified Polaribacter]|uniref:SusC/RagA family TonB-linked outer membrane protein n=1 Tax=unclassified Polaribacter TaxID=196858 RepID=UPI0011BFD83D|nr:MULTISPECIES: TonB-dependent receptor [unclassified Polaribacter]TXD53137.1 TonB-dependent receptor [Polaribacter sp. IC063]TXD61257.1 TonB-dependent receptor [Polaribacter sp. IC066]